MHENDLELPSDEDEEFEATAIGFRDKFRQLNGKFQEILLQESTVSSLHKSQSQEFLLPCAGREKKVKQNNSDQHQRS